MRYELEKRMIIWDNANGSRYEIRQSEIPQSYEIAVIDDKDIQEAYIFFTEESLFLLADAINELRANK